MFQIILPVKDIEIKEDIMRFIITSTDGKHGGRVVENLLKKMIFQTCPRETIFSPP